MFKKLLMVAVVVAVGMGMVYGANPDSFIVTCTPSLTYAVTISTPAAGLTFPAVVVGQSYVNTDTATVKNSGNVSADLTITGAALDTWQLASTPGSDAVMLLGCLKAGIASTGDFDVTLDTITTVEADMNTYNYTAGTTGDNVAVNGTRLLSLRLDAPTDSLVNVDQKFRVDIKAYVASKF
jgi:hypothetical protein